MKNKIILTLEFLLITAILVGSASAFGVSSPYWKDRPLEMAAGETTIVNLNLQNMMSSEDVTVKAKIEEGSDIASLSQTTYTVKGGTHDTMVPVKISLPEDATDSKVKIEFKTITGEDEGGAVLMGTGFITAFDVLVSEEASVIEEVGDKVVLTPALILVALMCLLVIAFAFYKTRKKNKK